ncbi:MAG: hypothetical protein IJF14_01840 [Clostridia bacterium]|nr:hypothetical protein [Clostridia bacterium]
MSESLQHQQLVKQIIAETISIVGEENKSLIATDAVDGFTLPPLTSEGFRPDVYYHYGSTLIIGEAKTSADIERLHSREQYESYIKKCSLYQGNALFIVAVPWMDHATINNILCKIKKKHPGNYEIKILDGIGGAI